MPTLDKKITLTVKTFTDAEPEIHVVYTGESSVARVITDKATILNLLHFIDATLSKLP